MFDYVVTGFHNIRNKQNGQQQDIQDISFLLITCCRINEPKIPIITFWTFISIFLPLLLS